MLTAVGLAALLFFTYTHILCFCSNFLFPDHPPDMDNFWQKMGKYGDPDYFWKFRTLLSARQKEPESPGSYNSPGLSRSGNHSQDVIGRRWGEGGNFLKYGGPLSLKVPDIIRDGSLVWTRFGISS